MKYLAGLAVFAALALLAPALPQDFQSWSVGQAVNTTSGVIQGHAAPNRTAVSEYLGIPYAVPPLSALRFEAPVAFSGSGVFQADHYSLYETDCPQLTPAAAPFIGEASDALHILDEDNQFGHQVSEDCLTLSVWTKPSRDDCNKAVIVWIYGGAFVSGFSDGPLNNGQYFADEEDVVIVALNYRVNIFGFPGLPGFEQNAGLLDQRLAIEWVRDNIAAFGGDPSRITIYGQSAGAASVDLYSYAWIGDPIVAGFIEQSGTATSFGDPLANYTTQWYNVSSQVGCGGAEVGANASRTCMQTVGMQELLDAISILPPSGLIGPFVPTIDNPYLIGSNNNEAGLYNITALEEDGNNTFPNLYWDLLTLVVWTCPVEVAANYRVAHDLPIWRYRYFGNFPNLELSAYSGAYHASDISVVFGTSEDYSGGANTPYETAVSAYMRKAWATFAKDPENGLRGYGWPEFNESDTTLIRLAYNSSTNASIALPDLYDYPCPTITPLTPELAFLLATFASPEELYSLLPPALLSEINGTNTL
ncbi:hypothetical protein MMC20_006376 [Loxospora ochrophaea]|nr:hypothetical protein [Loxospora ochrophaea]